MKKTLFMLLSVATVLAFTSCSKSDSPSLELYDALYSTIGGSLSNAKSVVKDCGYKYIIDEGEELICFKSDPEKSVSANYDYVVIGASENGKVGSAISAQIKQGNQMSTYINLVKGKGEIYQVNGDKLPFFMGATDKGEYLSFSQFQSALDGCNETSAVWADKQLNRLVQLGGYYEDDEDESMTAITFVASLYE